ncbi:MAG: RDD family protein [Dermatophilaceae bacterium]|jgi:uncharacterized RDD family membrane protein YckC|nr:RDD family protein [Actinomycetales bacterium]MBP9918474.1 RDD family protein [Dermatophilaceae bacterium]
MTQPPSQPLPQPAGWYDDPQNAANLRYWDGVLWTNNTVPKVSPSASSSSIGYSTDPYAASRQTAPVDYQQPPAHPGYAPAPTYAWNPGGPVTTDGRPLAQWWQRLLAAWLDSIITGIITAILGFPFMRDFFTWYANLLRDLSDSSNTADMATITEQVTAEMTKFVLPLTLISLVIGVVYTTFFLTRSGATPGKMALGIRVRRVNRSGPLTLVEALRRQALQVGVAILSLVPILGTIASPVSLLDPLWLLWDPRRQALHDKIADTVVEVKPKAGQY